MSGGRLSSAEALEVGLRTAKKQGLSARIEVVRRGPGSVTECRLSEGGREIMVGLGRGEGAEARVGALFEALERSTFRLVPPDGAHKIADLSQQPELQPSDVVHRIARTHPLAMAETWTYSGPTVLHYPSLLTNPFLGTAEARRTEFGPPYLRYSSGVGSAAGTSIDDAVLHALLELVEHDALGLAILRWFVSGEAVETVVAPAAMPSLLAARVDEIEQLARRRLHLVDITTDLAVPSYLAVLEDPFGRPPISGSAAAVSPLEAATKAVGEVEQMWVLYEGWPDADRSLAKWPMLERCRLMSHPWSTNHRFVPDWHTRVGEASLGFLEKRLREHGLATYRKVLTEPDAEVVVVSCLVPGLERFGLVRYGIPVVPTGRGRSLWDAARSGLS